MNNLLLCGSSGIAPRIIGTSTCVLHVGHMAMALPSENRIIRERILYPPLCIESIMILLHPGHCTIAYTPPMLRLLDAVDSLFRDYYIIRVLKLSTPFEKVYP